MGGMRQRTGAPVMERSEAGGRVGATTLFGGRRRRPLILIGAAVVGLCAVAALRQTAPADPTEPKAAPANNQPPRVRFTPSPATPPRGTLPKPDVVDRQRNRLIGNLPEAGSEPGEQTVFNGVNQILNWYCPESTALDSTIEQIQGWQSVRVITRPHPHVQIELSLNWTGGVYRWQGPLDALDRCW